MPRKSSGSSPPPTVGVLGLGYMGLASAAAFARRGVQVTGYDVVADRRETVRSGSSPFHEEGLGELVASETASGRLRVVDSIGEVVASSEILFLCLPTPPLPNGRIDLGPIEKGARDLGAAIAHADGFRLVVVKSTVVPGTAERVLAPILRSSAGKGPEELGVASNPEFLAEGTMVADALHPDRIVVGVEDTRSAKLLQALYAVFDSPLVVVTPAGAEMTKYAANSFLAMKISFANEISRFSERVGVDVDDVVRGFGSDPRIGERFLRAGPGFGGSCFSKDVRAFVRSARDQGVRLRLAEQIVGANDDQTLHAATLVRDQLPPGAGATVALLGLSFKEGTDDLRESRALPIAQELARHGVRVRAHDPAALAGFRRWLAAEPASVQSVVTAVDTVEEALRGADAAVLQVPWPEYLAWPSSWTRRMRRPVLVDLRRAFPQARAASQKLRLVRLGDGRTIHAPETPSPQRRPVARSRRGGARRVG
ncbi:MAG: UDP-glucose/GDP-mannose dehydrogenase family protein [Thermoplasmata archaeon]|nr:UDP-glucose/GDP-mannose dehydrogenase family protein [Thermoplasmata archaeon]